MALAETGALSFDDLIEIYPDMSHEVFYLCAAHNFRVRFGVFLGEDINSAESMNAGDIYQISYDANWIEVFRGNVPNDVEKRFGRRCGFDGYAA